MKYNFADFEEKWQKIWEENKIFRASSSSSLKKYYCLEMFPYPSGNIHMGHVRNYAIGDVISRHKMMCGFNVIHPIGWDAFGLPAENAAKQNNRHPAEWTRENIKKMRHQLKRMGLSYDWSREVATCLPEYYRWEQQLFIKMWEKGLAYKKRSGVNWCESCGTVLANEQVEDGKCWRCSSDVVQKELEQWFFKITEYAGELLDCTYTLLGWSENVLAMQRNWIGESSGAEITFDILGTDEKITVFSTRPDTLYGATFMLLAPEHPLADKLLEDSPQREEGLAFIKSITGESKEARMEDKQKKGFFTGRNCINPVTYEQMPIYIANYVLMDYGTGAVMAVPAHDERDFDFAKKYELPIVQVIQPKEDSPEDITEAYAGEGFLIQSDTFDGMSSKNARSAIVNLLEKQGSGKKSVTYRLRDWGVSRQRYWGTPVPFIYCGKCGAVPVPDKDLPVLLPENVKFDTHGNPLDSVQEFVNTVCPKCGDPARRETDTMDTFVESSWYFLRYCSPQYDKGMFDETEVNYWMPVDQYIGGVEHAVMHLLYARFFTKVLRDMGYINIDEPFDNLLTQGMVCKETQRCHTHGWLNPSEVKDGNCVHCQTPVIAGRTEKMSKSKKNVVDPDDLIKTFGADTLRLFSLFAAPPDKEIDWSESGVEGCYRFISRVFRLVTDHLDLLKSDIPEADVPQGEVSTEIFLYIHATVKKTTTDIERFQFNTAVAAIMEFVNSLYILQDKLTDTATKSAFKSALITLMRLCAPFTPHVAEELWSLASMHGFISCEGWPTYKEEYTLHNNITIAVQINGKIRAKITVPRNCSEQEVIEKSLADEKVVPYTKGRILTKKIYVHGKLVSIVVK
ncbi:MAG: leucine--tRNA ligase [Deferribacteraceae bacterium]|jgi:leucyl-tRNA synthetase|nr:leucine--tRNA ligase [Deferribacteraceae bacterium]